MNISRESLICKIVLLSIFLTPVGAFFELKVIEFLPFLILFTYFFSLLVNRNITLNFNNNFYLAIFLLFFYILFQLLLYRNVASLGSVSVFILSIIFFKILDYKKIDFKVLVKKISYIYVICIIFIIIELLLIINGYQEIFKELFFSNIVKGYKDYNSAHVLKNIFGIEGVGGPNSLLLGSQSASMLTLFSILWFSNIFIGDKFKGTNIKCSLFFLISFLLYPLVATMTVNITGLILFLLLIFFFANSKLNRFKYKLIIFTLFLFFSNLMSNIFLFRINTTSDIEEYSATLTELPEEILNSNLFEIFFGHGKYSISEMSGSGFNILGDFGLMHILYEAGFFFFAFVLTVLFIITINVLMLISFCKKNYPDYLENPWFSFMSINLILALGYLISLSHYTTAIETGGRFIFALHIALALLSLKKIKEFIHSNRKTLRS